MAGENTTPTATQEPTLNDLNRAMGTSMEAELERFEHGKIPPSPDEKKQESKEQPQKEVQEDKPDKDSSKEPAELPKIEDFGKLLGETNDIVKKLGDDTRKKEENKKEEEEPEEEQQVDYRKAPDDTGKPARDLSGFGDRETKWLQRMPYEAYQHFSKVLREGRTREESYKKEKEETEKKITALQAGRVELPASYYANPKAIILSPEYEDMQQAVNLSQEIEQHWRSQMERIEKGEPWYDLVQDPKTGKIYVKNEPEDPTASAKTNVMAYYLHVSNQTQQYIGKLSGLVESHKAKVADYDTRMKGYEKAYMPVFEDEKGVEHGIYKQVAEKLPSIGIDKDNPAFRMLAKSCALNLILKDIILQQQNGKSKESAADESRRAGPTSKHTSGGGSPSGKPAAATLDDFKKFGLPPI